MEGQFPDYAESYAQIFVTIVELQIGYATERGIVTAMHRTKIILFQ